MVRKLCPVGPLLRCTGIARDVRVEDPYAAYDEIIPDVKTSNDGDIASLLLLRIEEVKESCRLVLEAFEKIPSGPVKLTAPRSVPKGEAIFHVEAPRGELLLLREVAGRNDSRSGQDTHSDDGKFADCNRDAEGTYSRGRTCCVDRNGSLLWLHGQSLNSRAGQEQAVGDSWRGVKAVRN